MNFGNIKAMAKTFVRPSGTGSPTIDANIGTWINEGLRTLYRLRRWWFLQTGATITTSNGVQQYSVPSTGIYLVEATLGSRPIKLVQESIARGFYASSGQPEAISLVYTPGNLWNAVKLWPTPDGAYTVNLTYTSPLPDLVNDTDTNFITNQFPYIPIYWAVYQAMAYLQEDQLAGVYLNLYNQQVQELAKLDAEIKRYGVEMDPTPPFVPAQASTTVASPGQG